MGKFKYVIARIFKMDYKNMFTLIDKVSKKYNRSKLYIFFDIVYCGFRHQAGFVDYDFFRMYELNEKERKDLVTRGRNNEYVKKLNPKAYWHIFDNKNEFNAKFNKYLGRDWLYLDGKNQKEFDKFVKNKDYIIVKPNDLSCGKGVRKIKMSDCKDYEKLYNELLKDNTPLVEEVASQNKVIASLHPNSVNTVRIVTIINKHNVPKVATAIIRVGSNDNIVDNYNNGGMVATIDIETGVIVTDAINAKGEIFKRHPNTNVKFEGFKIPHWKQIVDLTLESAMVVKEVRMVGWDVCLGKNGPVLIEGNQYPGHVLYKPIAAPGDSIGVAPIFDEILK